jgi:hypothetical protein
VGIGEGSGVRRRALVGRGIAWACVLRAGVAARARETDERLRDAAGRKGRDFATVRRFGRLADWARARVAFLAGLRDEDFTEIFPLRSGRVGDDKVLPEAGSQKELYQSGSGPHEFFFPLPDTPGWPAACCVTLNAAIISEHLADAGR